MKSATYTRVIFRIDRHRQVTAVLPDVPANAGHWVSYAHLGQHSECSRAWYYSTKPAKPAEYEPLLKELRGIYETGTAPVRVRVMQRISGGHRW